MVEFSIVETTFVYEGQSKITETYLIIFKSSKMVIYIAVKIVIYSIT